MSKASDIAMQFSTRLSGIRVSSGYATDIGERVFRGRVNLDPTELPCVVMVEGDDEVEDSKRSEVKIAQTLTFEGHDICDPAQPNDKAHLLLADLKKCIFGVDPTTYGLVRPSDLEYVGRSIGVREDGSTYVAASITIRISYVENLANP